jgi:pectin lyase
MGIFFVSATLLIVLSAGCFTVKHIEAIGNATGFAAGVTGGGDLPQQIPADIDELARWLADDTPRVILLDRTFDYSDIEGTVTEMGCRPPSNTCPCKGGQDSLNEANYCQDKPPVSVSYNKASLTPLVVNSNKTILGKGKRGVLKGKGLRITNGALNIIIQNIHITQLNPQYIWGGDAIAASNADMIWIDHCKFSLIGRQMIVTGFDKAGRMTISNCEFDGLTSWSASCDQHHYWTLLIIGAADQVTFQNNYIHHTSGRGPEVGGPSGSVVLHAVNNYWANTSGVALGDENNSFILLEGNYFENVSYPRTYDPKGQVFAPLQDSPTCEATLGRSCLANKISGPTKLPLTGNNTNILDLFTHESRLNVTSADQVKSYVIANAGIGIIN